MLNNFFKKQSEKQKNIIEDISKIEGHFNDERSEIERLKDIKTINPFKKVKIKQDIKKIEKDIKQKKKEIEKQIRIEKQRKTMKYYLIASTAIMVALFVITGIAYYRKNVNRIKFVNSEDTIYVGDTLDLQYQVRPSSAEYDSDDISVIFDNNNLLEQSGDSYKSIEEGTIKASIVYKNNTYDQKIINIIPIEVQSLNVQDIDIGVNLESELTINFFPENSTHKKVFISSSNSDVVKVIDNKIIGVSEGITKVNVKSVDGPETTFTVNVIYVDPNSMSIEKNIDRYEPGVEDDLTIVFSPDKISNSNPEIKRESSNNNVISVDNNGHIKCLQRGNATVTAYYSEEVFASENINVIYPEPTNVSISGKSNELYKGYKMTLSANFEPELVEDSSIEWSSSDDDKATVNENGTVTAISYGEVYITAKTINGLTDKFKITITEAPTINNNQNSNRRTSSSNDNNGISGTGSFYTSDSANCFHTQNPCHGNALDNPRLVTLEEARNEGKKPCYWCAKGY